MNDIQPLPNPEHVRRLQETHKKLMQVQNELGSHSLTGLSSTEAQLVSLCWEMTKTVINLLHKVSGNYRVEEKPPKPAPPTSTVVRLAERL
jgi:hypothetical protein